MNSIVDLQDKEYMALLNVNDEAIEDLKKRFEVPQLAIPDPHHMLVEVDKKIDTVIHQYI